MLLPLARLQSTSGGRYNSIEVFTTTGQMAANYIGVLLPVFRKGLRVEPNYRDTERGCETTGSVHYLRLPSPVALQKGTAHTTERPSVAQE